MSEFLTSKELFINVKNPPRYNPKKSYFDQDLEVLEFYQEERRRLIEGVTIGGYFIHPWLYYHINFFKTPIPQPDGSEPIISPPLDDNFLFFIENYQDAERQNLGLALMGCRGYSKSTGLASLISWLNLTKENGVTSVIGGSEKDLGAISALMSKNFMNMNPAFYLPHLKMDWDKEVEFGLKEKGQHRMTYSQLSITNASKGTSKSSEKGAGLSPVGFIMDEALQEDELLHLEGGVKPIKDIVVGDEIFGGDGKLTKVLDKINPGVVDVYKFTLSDGREVTSSDNHLWKVYDTRYSKWVVKTTKEIRKKYFYNKLDKRSGKLYKSLVYSLPLNEALEYTEKDLKIDPYWLGLWLGDGDSTIPSVCSIDNEITTYCEEYAARLGLTSNTQHPTKVVNKEFRTCSITNKGGSDKVNPLKSLLREYTLLDNKHIPEIYLKGSVKQRLELLKGLMDTDGSCDEKGYIEFSSSNRKLAEGFQTLCRSLGIRCTRTKSLGSYTKNGVRTYTKMKYRFSLNTELEVFNLKRKLLNYKVSEGNNNTKKYRSYKERVSIKNIEYVGEKQTYCIKVDNEDKLFVVGDFVVTHNCGKFACKGILQSALPSFKTQYGAKLVHVLSGTTGNKELSKDAKDILLNPKEYDLITMDWDRLERGIPEEAITWKESKKTQFSMFVPGQMSYRLEVPKVKSTLADYLGVENPDLAKVGINLTNWKEATAFIEEKNASFKKDEDRDKNRMYYPRNISEVFLIESSNPFPTSVIERHIRNLEDSGKIGRDIEIYKEGGKATIELVNKKRAEVSHGGGPIDAPIIAFAQVPETPPARGTCVSGLDGYKIDVSETDSLGSLYVLKRRHLAANEPCETIQCSYTARPDRMKDFNNTCEKVIETWNAECCMESIDMSFKQHLDTKGKAEQLLCPAFSFTSVVSKTVSSLNSKFGLYPNAQNNQYRFNVLIDYCKEEHVIDIDEDGNEVIKYGVEFIDDIDLLKEMLSWYKGGNFDRITAFSHALVFARELDKKGITPKQERRETEHVKKKRAQTRGFFSKRRHNPF